VPGLQRTLAELRSQQIPHCGAGLTHEDACQPAVVTVKGKSVAVFNFGEGEYAQAQGNGPGAARLDPFWSENRVQRARSQYDIIIVIIHAGNEYQPIPSLVTAAFCRRMADAGADAVIAHHAHIPQGMEYRNGVPICFSLGNFLFGNEFGNHKVAWPGVWYMVSVAELDFTGAGVTLTLHPFKQMPDLALAELSPRGRAAFDQYLARCNAVIADPALHQRYWEQEARELFRGRKQSLADLTQKLNSDNEEEAYQAAKVLYGLVHCDAHHETLERGLRLIYERRFADDPEAVQGLADLRALANKCFAE
jgi:poly-gamma-glutamate synthesis protein (capsule biosynthesis protein)